mgnify:CR=1 FL=1
MLLIYAILILNYILNIQKYHLGYTVEVEFDNGFKMIYDRMWLQKIKKDPIRIFTPDDPYGEENWENENMRI